MVAHGGIEGRSLLETQGACRYRMRNKNQKPPICIGGSEKTTRYGCPGYMNVPFPAPCHVPGATLAKQLVWRLRIIACSSSLLLHHSMKSVGQQPALPIRAATSLRRMASQLMHTFSVANHQAILFDRETPDSHPAQVVKVHAYEAT
jgi:hypothetical protein